jgi:hypothetical protein
MPDELCNNIGSVLYYSLHYRLKHGKYIRGILGREFSLVCECFIIKKALFSLNLQPLWALASDFHVYDHFTYHWEDQGVGGWTILKWILERKDGMLWI